MISRTFVIVYILLILSKTKNKVKKTLFASFLIRIRQNNQSFVKDCFALVWIVKIFHQTHWRQNGRQQQIEPAILRCDSNPF